MKKGEDFIGVSIIYFAMMEPVTFYLTKEAIIAAMKGVIGIAAVAVWNLAIVLKKP